MDEVDEVGERGPAATPLSTESTSSRGSTPSTTRPDEAAANAALVLINVASALLARQINSLALAFESQGGFTERLYNVRRGRRDG
jgi:four helix bundle suffix protein